MQAQDMALESVAAAQKALSMEQKSLNELKRQSCCRFACLPCVCLVSRQGAAVQCNTQRSTACGHTTCHISNNIKWGAISCSCTCNLQ